MSPVTEEGDKGEINEDNAKVSVFKGMADGEGGGTRDYFGKVSLEESCDSIGFSDNTMHQKLSLSSEAI